MGQRLPVGWEKYGLRLLRSANEGGKTGNEYKKAEPGGIRLRELL